ncbi:MAG: TldD/PmbA family protein [Planctomycetes bacterium]|nr:TldD/PmbA family protein [Planctomycetota bacterium]
MEQSIKNAIRLAPADYLEIRIQEGAATGITYAGKELEAIGEMTGLGGCVRALVGGGWGFASFTDIAHLPKYVEMACEQARLVGDAGVRLAPVAPHTDTVSVKPEIDPAAVPLADKHALCEKYNRILLKNDRVQTSSVRYRDASGQIIFANSEGSFITQRMTFCGVSVFAIAKDGMNVQRAYESTGDLRGYENALGLEEKCDEIAKRAIDLLNADPVKAGRYAVVIDPELCGVFVHEAFGHLSEADFVHENDRLQEIMVLGRRFGPDVLAIVDDGSMKGEAGYMAYDSEGTPTQRTPLLNEGILVGRLHSRETAAKMNEAPTGNARALSHAFEPIVRMTNTFMEPRDATFEGMLEGIANGIYAVGAIGGQTNMEMFTFSAEDAYEIRNGTVGRRLRDVVLTGNVFQTLGNIDAVGNDLKLYGGLGGCGKGGQGPLRTAVGGPHVRIKDVLIGGR